MKYGFYVSNKATRLIKTILYLQSINESNRLLDDVVFVFRDSETEDELVELCKRTDIKYYQKDMASFDNRDRSDVISNELLSAMERLNTDYLFVFGSRLLKGDLLKTFKNKIINFHPSLLPAFPGVKSIDQAKRYGSILTGNTAHFIDEGIDTGPIIMQNVVILKGDTHCDAILDNQIPMLIQIMIWLNDNRITVKDRTVIVKEANYMFDRYIPNLEIKYKRGYGHE